MKQTSTALERRLDTLLRGEIAAAESYQILIDKVEDPQTLEILRSINDEHGEAIGFLYAQLAERGAEPSKHSGPWGVFARAVEGTAAMIGDKTALTALREGESRGLKDYQDALSEGLLPNEARQKVEETFVPQQEKHIEALSRLIDAA